VVAGTLALLQHRERVYADDLLICAVAELDVLTVLARLPMDERALSDELGTAVRPTTVLISLLRAYGLVTRAADRTLLLTEAAERTLVAGAPQDMRAYFASLRSRPAVQELLQVLRTDEPASWSSDARAAAWEQSLDQPEQAASLTAGMDARGAVLAPLLAERLDLAAGTRVLDIGGASGIYGQALLDRWPHLQVAVLERPPVDDIARRLLEQSPRAGMAVLTGNMFDPLPTGYDVHLYSHVLHDWGEDDVRALLSQSFAALSSGGCVIDFDAHLDQDAAGPVEVAEYSALLMHSTKGRCYSVAELATWLTEVGFVDIEERPVGSIRSALVARKP
jgi:hypothetical protein